MSAYTIAGLVILVAVCLSFLAFLLRHLFTADSRERYDNLLDDYLERGDEIARLEKLVSMMRKLIIRSGLGQYLIDIEERVEHNA